MNEGFANMQGKLDTRAAVNTAKDWLLEIFADEEVSSPRLEEIQLDHGADAWEVTISFKRDGKSLADVFGGRTFKVVRIDDRTGEVIGMTHRSLPEVSPR